ncbi:TadE/TadG family type IV pilus assembly protein [Streptomyces sp. TS71-3]|uniref:TadE/TadG family type IV pilus assembly protein n=1 Tax=Streptomyces sp. TS71-3 TaxID=2733862 RepID=UPI001B055111|nr:TadE/TadG family type IV pilus assembly protein [Streptomyces sp. TS71-3]GHJ35349.1 septum formation initiator [Streptomyces sp. TS71-3]
MSLLTLPTASLRRGSRSRIRTPAVRRREGGDRGQVAIEYVGLLPILLLVGVACIQLGLAVYAAQQAGTAARAAARVASQAHTPADPQTAGRAAISDWLSASVSQSGGGFDSVTYTARVDVPSIIPGVGFGTAQRSVTMPRD